MGSNILHSDADEEHESHERWAGSATTRRASGSATLMGSSSVRRRNETDGKPPRLVEEVHAPYEVIQSLIAELSRKYRVAINPAPKMKKHEGHWARDPHFFAERDLLSEQVSSIRFPHTVQYADYKEDPSKNPVVMKDETVSRGERKFLLENREQLKRFRAWMKAHGQVEHWLAQEHIETPGSAPCSYRVLVDCTGHILTSQINYGLPHRMNARKDGATLTETTKDSAKLLELPSSEFFLDARAIASNHMLLNQNDTTVGGRITLDPLPISHPYNPVEMQILKTHGLDAKPPMLPQLPTEVSRIASGIGKALGMKGKKVHELVLGVDIVQRKGTELFYVLEANRCPSMAPIRDMLGSANSTKELDVWRWLINGAMHRVMTMHKE